MTNLGFQRFCEENGMKFEATKVGDRYVLEEMRLDGYNFGGEQSGHVIASGTFATTGDGQLTACQLLSLLRRREAKLSSLATLSSALPPDHGEHPGLSRGGSWPSTPTTR